MRAMKKLPETIVSLYNNGTLLITNYFIIKYNGGTYDTWNRFDLIDWLSMISLSVVVLLS